MIDPETVTETALPEVLPELPKPKKSKLPVILAIAFVAVLALGSVALYAMNFQKRDFLQLIQGADKYARNLILDSVKNNTKEAIAELNATDLTTQAALAENMSIVSNASVNIVGSDATKDGFLAGLIMPEELLPVGELLIDSGIDFNMNALLTNENPLFDMNLAWLLKDTSILNLDVLARGDNYYVSVPELLSKYIGVNLQDLGYGESSQAFQDGLFTGQTAGLETAEYLKTNSAVLDAMINDIAINAMAEVQTFEIANNVEVTLGESTFKYDIVSYVMTAKELEDVCKSAIITIKDNAEYRTFIIGLANLIQPETLTEEVLIADLEEALAGDMGITSERNVFSFYVDQKNEIKGFTFNDGESSFSLVAEFGAGWDMLINSEGTSVRLFGKLEGSLTDMSGDATLDLTNGSINFKLKVLDFTASAEKATLTIPSGDILTEIGKLSPIDLYGADDFLLNSVLTIEATGDTKAMQSNIALMHKTSDLGLTIDSNTEVTEPNAEGFITPADDEVIYYDMYTEPEIDIMEVLDNLQIVMTKIEGLGYNIDFLYEIFGSMMGY